MADKGICIWCAGSGQEKIPHSACKGQGCAQCDWKGDVFTSCTVCQGKGRL